MGSIYNEKGKCVRIEGRIESGNVPHSRRVRHFIGSRYSVGKARSGNWTAGRPYPLGHSMGSR